MKASPSIKTAVTCAFASLALFTLCSPLRGADATPPASQSSASSQPITQDQWAKLTAAHEKAMQDPKVVAARDNTKKLWDDYLGIVRKKVLANDASMAPLLDKADKIFAAMESGSQPPPMTADEQKSLRDAVTKVESDPEIKDAMAKFTEAKKAKDVLVRAAILKADPSLEPVLETIDQLHKPAPAAAGH